MSLMDDICGTGNQSQQFSIPGIPDAMFPMMGGIQFDFNVSDNFSLQSLCDNISGDFDVFDDIRYQNRLRYYLSGIAGTTVCCVGIVANILSVIVLTRRTMRSSTYMYLASLAVCDALVLLFTLLLIVNKDTKPPKEVVTTVDQFNAVLFPFVHPTAIVFQVTSIWLTLAFTVDRYIMICHPFSAEHMCRRSRARKVIVALYLGGLLFNIPRYLEYKTTMQEYRVENVTQVIRSYGIDTTEIGGHELFRELIHSWLYLTCVCATPFITLVVLNTFLIHAVRLSRQKGKEINAREKRRNDTTIMLIGVIVIFLICQGPALVSRMIYAFNPTSAGHKGIYTLNEVGNFLVMLNSAINIVPYYFFGKKFRMEFLRLFCCCYINKDEMERIMLRKFSASVDHRQAANHCIEKNGMNHNTNYLSPGLDNQQKKNLVTPLLNANDNEALCNGGGYTTRSPPHSVILQMPAGL